jgi:hypothetical protein
MSPDLLEQLQLFPGDSIEYGYTDLSRGARCVDCDVNTGEIGEDYMVRDQVWREAHPIWWGFPLRRLFGASPRT